MTLLQIISGTLSIPFSLSLLLLNHFIFIFHMHLQILHVKLEKGMLKLFLKSTCMCMTLKKPLKTINLKLKNEKGMFL